MPTDYYEEIFPDPAKDPTYRHHPNERKTHDSPNNAG
nr:MAG TPA: hypothetical protein [Caudoviricetes sp.]